MDDLITFVLARLDEREAVARAAILRPDTEPPGRWDAYIEGGGDGWAFEGYGEVGGIVGDQEVAEHIADNDPAFVLDDIAAKREIIDLFVPCPACLAGRRCIPHDSSVSPPGFWRFLDDDHERIARLLALPFASHPDYRAEWRP